MPGHVGRPPQGAGRSNLGRLRAAREHTHDRAAELRALLALPRAPSARRRDALDLGGRKRREPDKGIGGAPDICDCGRF